VKPAPRLPDDPAVARHLRRLRAWHRDPTWAWQPWPPPPGDPEERAFWTARELFDAEREATRRANVIGVCLVVLAIVMWVALYALFESLRTAGAP
jgi:hypothetical protein